MCEKSPGEQRIGLIKRDEQPSATLDPARACFHAAKSLCFSGWVCTIARAETEIGYSRLTTWTTIHNTPTAVLE